MPPAHRPAPDTVPARSRLVARCVLLAACALGLLGLAAPGHAPRRPVQMSASATMATRIEVEPRAPHTLAAPAPVVAQRASRSRTIATPKKRAVAKKHVSGWVRPSYAGIVSPFGMRWGRLHKGVDFGAHYGAPIFAIGDGVVVGTGYQSGESGYGQITIIRHSNGYYSAYAHQSSYLVHVGEHVTAGEVIGYVGSTGNVTGPHLHFEIRTVEHGGQINPVPWLRAHGVRV